MTAFDGAWLLLKTDMRLPGPQDVPQYADSHANLAFYGSANPDWRRHWNPYPENMSNDDFAQSIRDEIARRKGEMVIPPLRDYEIGDFSEALQEGEKSKTFGGERNMGIQQLYGELDRASVVEALHNAGIHDIASLENILEEYALFDMAGLIGLQERGQRMGNDRGWQMRRVE